MRPPLALRLLLLSCLLLAGRKSSAQAAPWSAPPEPVIPEAPVAPPEAASTPSLDETAAPTSVAAASSASPDRGPAASVPIAARYGVTPDPAFSYNFQAPTARPLHHGDSMITVAGDLGWVGVRYGLHRRFDAGVGLPYYLTGISFDARYAIVLGSNVALSLWAFVTVPFLPGDRNATSYLGFTWQGGGAAWVTGPVFSVWGGNVGLHVGAHLAQRVLLGGAWVMLHVTVEGRITDAVRAIAQGVLFGEVVNESGGSNARALVGSSQPRVMPYMVTGLRLHSRRFAVDFGALIALAAGAPLSNGSIGIWPWTSVSQTF